MEQKKKKVDVSSLLFGKVPPYSKELESQVIGIMLLEPQHIPDVDAVLTPDDFYLAPHKILCTAIFDISKEGICDTSLVAEWLVKKNKVDDVGGLYYLIEVTKSVVSSVNISKYCAILKQKSIQRRLIEFGGVVLSKAGDETEDVFDVLLEAELKLKGINTELEELNVTPLTSIAMNVINGFEDKVYKAKNDIVDEKDVYTGIREWDDINGRLFPGLYVVAGRPGMGKGVHMTELICRMGKMFDVGVINGEMTDEQLLTRIGCNLLTIDNFLFKKNPKYVTDEEQSMVREAMNEAVNLKLHIENNRYIHKIASKIKMWVERQNVKVVLADFLTLFKVHDDISRYFTDTQRVNYVLDVFVSLCKDLKIPIILYVQMNRQILGRAGVKEPNMSDLKQSGNIEELSYQVSFLHRPEYYDENEIQDEMGESTKGLMYQIISKHRDGKLGKIKLKANLPSSQLKSWPNDDFRRIVTENPF